MSTEVATVKVAPAGGVRALFRGMPIGLVVAVVLFLVAGLVGAALLLVPDLSKLVFRQALAKAYAAPFTKDTLLGADQLGRPLEWRLLAGLGISLGSAAAVTLIATTIGLAMGLLGGFFGRTVDRIVTIIIDVTWAYRRCCSPSSSLASRGRGLDGDLGARPHALGGDGAHHKGAGAGAARAGFVLAVRALGYGRFYIATRHLIPNLAPTCILMATLFVALTIVAERASASSASVRSRRRRASARRWPRASASPRPRRGR